MNKQNIQVPCIGQHACNALRTCSPLCNQAFDKIDKPLCICCSCYENLGGYIYHHPGQGIKATTCITKKLHDDDVTKGLKFLGNWLINIAQTEKDEMKKKILKETFETLLPFTSPLNQKYTNKSTTNISMNQEKISLDDELSSLFMIKVLFIEISKKKEIGIDSKNFKMNDFEKIGHEFGQKIWNSRSEVNSKKSSLKFSQIIKEYYDAFPEFINSFFSEIIDELCQKKIMVCNWQRKNRQQLPKIITSE